MACERVHSSTRTDDWTHVHFAWGHLGQWRHQSEAIFAPWLESDDARGLCAYRSVDKVWELWFTDPHTAFAFKLRFC